ncbi:MAG: hypothetical protein V2J20_00690 [Wenzhouxiangella sp.]|nr:hypothetical protein [Wenzhouxiangella sp.]
MIKNTLHACLRAKKPSTLRDLTCCFSSTIHHSVISGNGRPDDGVPDCDLPRTDAVTSLGFNYVEESCLDTPGPGAQTGETPQLSGLGDQRGITYPRTATALAESLIISVDHRIRFATGVSPPPPSFRYP